MRHVALQNVAFASNQSAALLLYYDDYHTPLHDLRGILPLLETVVVSLGARKDEDAGDLAKDVVATRVDRRDWFADHYLARAIRADARYQQHYALSSALARPALGEIVADIVGHRHDLVIHGFAGNDQLRFEAALGIVRPGVNVRSAVDLLGSRTLANGDGFTRSCNLWGRTLEAGVLSDPGVSSRHVAFDSPRRSATQEFVIGFEAGLPISIDGRRLSLAALILELTAIGCDAGIAWHDMIEDGHVGLKTRALYHSPAADILAVAHSDLVRFVSSRREVAFRQLASAAWADLVYDGGWFDPLRADLDAYFEYADRYVTGNVRVAIDDGQVRVTARDSRHALYDESSAVYRAGQDFGGNLIRGLRDQAVQLGRLGREREGGVQCDD